MEVGVPYGDTCLFLSFMGLKERRALSSTHWYSRTVFLNGLRLTWIVLLIWGELGLYFRAVASCQWPDADLVRLFSFNTYSPPHSSRNTTGSRPMYSSSQTRSFKMLQRWRTRTSERTGTSLHVSTRMPSYCLGTCLLTESTRPAHRGKLPFYFQLVRASIP